MYNISILTIGDEICIGQIINTNAAWIASKCTELGANIVTHSSIRDEKSVLIKELDRLIQSSDMLIITGGLGPTHDDITKDVITEYFQDELVIDKEWEIHLLELFETRGYKFTDRNREQSLVPSHSKVLFNNIGTAPGLLLEIESKKVIALPGVPTEMKAIFQDNIISIIKNDMKQRNDHVLLYKNYQVSGIAESKLADLIGKPEEFLNGGTLAFLPSFKGIRLRVGVSAENFDTGEKEIMRIEKLLYDKAGKFIFGTGEESLTTKIGQYLIKNKETVSVAESCTGGLLGGELTKISGSSEYFVGGVIVYSNEAKMKILGIEQSTLVQHGAVSEELAKQLAKNVRIKFNTHYGIGITGVAGPTGGTDDKPIGTVWIGLSSENSTFAQRFLFGNDRDMNRERAVGSALNMLVDMLKSKEHSL